VKSRQPVIRMLTGRFFLLLVTILLMFIIRPLVESRSLAGFVFDLTISLVLVSGVFAVSRKRSSVWIALMLVVPAVGLTWLEYGVSIPNARLWELVLGIAFFVYAGVCILEFIFSQREVTSEVISGAICVFFLMGMFWAYVYAIVEMFTPGAFQGDLSTGKHSGDFFYFSYTTLTTLGYGDVTPVFQTAKNLAMLEAISGQMYLAVIIARLVGIQTALSIESRKDRSQGALQKE
jgi:hypothetical protein